MKYNKINKNVVAWCMDPTIKTKLDKRLEHNFSYYKANRIKIGAKNKIKLILHYILLESYAHEWVSDEIKGYL